MDVEETKKGKSETGGSGMTTERMIRVLDLVAEKHKYDLVPTCQINITNMCRDIIPKLELLGGSQIK